jgi:GNAT superfamily N-acetyltransferase
MATTYRLCGPADLDRTTELLVAWLREDGRPVDSARVRRAVSGLLGDTRTGHAWIIERGGRPAGYTALTFSAQARSAAPRAYVTALYLSPEHRGQGIGTRTERFLSEIGAWLQIPVHCFDTSREAKHASALLRVDLPKPSQPTLDLNQAVA